MSTEYDTVDIVKLVSTRWRELESMGPAERTELFSAMGFAYHSNDSYGCAADDLANVIELSKVVVRLLRRIHDVAATATLDDWYEAGEADENWVLDEITNAFKHR